MGILSNFYISWHRRQWHPTPVLLLGESHGRRKPGRLQSVGSLESDRTERLHFHFPLSSTGEGNGNPLQCSCLENPRDGGAWWAAVYGIAQSRTRLKRLSSSSSSTTILIFFNHLTTKIMKKISTFFAHRPFKQAANPCAVTWCINSKVLKHNDQAQNKIRHTQVENHTSKVYTHFLE